MCDTRDETEESSRCKSSRHQREKLMRSLRSDPVQLFQVGEIRHDCIENEVILGHFPDELTRRFTVNVTFRFERRIEFEIFGEFRFRIPRTREVEVEESERMSVGEHGRSETETSKVRTGSMKSERLESFRRLEGR